eukprot:NODE_676_length_5303_cov_0.411991.p2 type:complete len:210 gc:universal NODE_676_length_5303_cov_0.411991:1103-1732(+)
MILVINKSAEPDLLMLFIAAAFSPCPTVSSPMKFAPSSPHIIKFTKSVGNVPLYKRAKAKTETALLYHCESFIGRIKEELNAFYEMFEAGKFLFEQQGQDTHFVNSFGDIRIYPVSNLFDKLKSQSLSFTCDCKSKTSIAIYESENFKTGVICPETATKESFIEALYRAVMENEPPNSELHKIDICSVVKYFGAVYDASWVKTWRNIYD